MARTPFIAGNWKLNLTIAEGVALVHGLKQALKPGVEVAVCPTALYPHAAYGSLPTLTTTDNQIYTFGTDANGYAKFPMGKGNIFRSLNDGP